MKVGYLHHVIDLFQRIGFRVWTRREPPPEQEGDWLVHWAHEYPFTASYKLPALKPFQKVNRNIMIKIRLQEMKCNSHRLE